MIYVNETHYISENDDFIINITEPVFVVSVDINYTTQNEPPMSMSFMPFDDDFWIIAYENLSVAVACWGFVYHEYW